MEKIYRHLSSLMLALLALVALGGCDAEKDLVVIEMEMPPYDQVYILGNWLNGNSSNTAVAMTKSEDPYVFTYRIELKHYDDNKQFKFCTEPTDWDKTYYIVPASGIEAGTSFAYLNIGAEQSNPAEVCSEITHDLKDHFWGIREGEDGFYEVTLNLKTMNVTALFVSASVPDPELYMQGLAGNTGMDSNNPGVQLAYDKETKRFSWEGNLIYSESEGNRQFNFITSKGNWDQVTFLIPKEGDSDGYRQLVEDGGVYEMKTVSGPGNPLSASWGIAEENNGKYRIEVDVLGMKLYVTKLADAEQPIYDQVYILGKWLNDNASNTAVAMEKTDDPNIFTYRMALKYYDENKQFKFCTEPTDWDKTYYIVPASGIEAGTSFAYLNLGAEQSNPALVCSEITGDLKDHFWGIRTGEDGFYEITLNVKTLNVTVVFLSDAAPDPELYLQGMAGNSGMDSNNPGVQLAYDKETKRFSWEGDLIYTTSENNRQFNFITGKGNWDKVTFLVPKEGDSDSYRQPVADGGVYEMKAVSGPGNPLAASWSIEEANNGKYRIEVDVENMTLYVTKIE